MRLSSAAVQAVFVLGSLRLIESQICEDKSIPKKQKGPSGPILDFESTDEFRTDFKKGDRVKIDRRGGENCGCSFVSTKCRPKPRIPFFPKSELFELWT